MKFLFIFTDLQIGGIETLILRSAKWLMQNGHEVTVIVSQGGDLISDVRRYADVSVLGKTQYHFTGFSIVRRNFRDDFDIIHTFSYDSAWLGAQISKGTNAKLAVGVYHPKAFTFYQGMPPFFISKYFHLFRSLPEENIFFMNLPTQKSHEEYYEKSFQRSRILPLPIDEVAESDILNRYPKNNPYKIVSVGRLVDFKVYHYGVMDAVKRLIDEDIKIEYHIYGDGRLRNDLKKYVIENNLSNNIFLHGEVKYNNFQMVIRDAYIFLGMGTSLAEAAMNGIPSLAMPTWDRSGNTYGLFHSLKDYSLGESGKKTDVFNEFKELIQMDSREYYEVCNHEKNAASRFSTNSIMNNYISYCKDLRQISYTPSLGEALAVIFSRLLNTKIPYLKKKLIKQDLRYQL